MYVCIRCIELTYNLRGGIIWASLSEPHMMDTIACLYIVQKHVQVYVCMKVQKVYLLQQSQSLGESHLVPAQTLPTYQNC